MTWRPAIWLVAAGVVILDQGSKQWALTSLAPYEVHPVLGDWMSIQLVFNGGAAFSLGEGYTWVLTLIAIAVSVGIVVYARRARSTTALWLFGIGLGGAVGNLIDRLFRAPGFGRGHVVDFINYGNQFVGNVADIAIVGAAIAVAVLAALGVRVLAPTHPEAPPAEQLAGLAARTAVADGDAAPDGSAATARD